jgi:hypothetical protein
MPPYFSCLYNNDWKDGERIGKDRHGMLLNDDVGMDGARRVDDGGTGVICGRLERQDGERTD